jgi:hypothetical protein
MIRSEGARRLIAFIAVAAAALAQDIIVGEAGANHLTPAPALLSADLLTSGTPASAQPPASAGQSYGVRLSPVELTAPVALTPRTENAPVRLSWLNLFEGDPGLSGSLARWPANRDSAGVPIVLDSDFTGSLITVSF